jgi:hypothetical protein
MTTARLIPVLMHFKEIGNSSTDSDLCVMKNLLILAVMAATACGGGLTDEQRKRIKEEMANSKIQRVSEADIAEAAYATGRKAVGIMISSNLAQIDSVLSSDDMTIRFIKRNEPAKTVEAEIIEAYKASEQSGVLEDNIQPIRSADGSADSVLYTYPITEKREDKNTFQGMWSIRMSKKHLVLSLTQKN